MTHVEFRIICHCIEIGDTQSIQLGDVISARRRLRKIKYIFLFLGSRCADIFLCAVDLITTFGIFAFMLLFRIKFEPEQKQNEECSPDYKSAKL
jgi:hypothetical protein